MPRQQNICYKIYHLKDIDVAQKIDKYECVDSVDVIVEINTNERDFDYDNVVMSRVLIKLESDYELNDIDKHLRDEFISTWFDF